MKNQVIAAAFLVLTASPFAKAESNPVGQAIDDADFVVCVVGVHTEKFDLGLLDYDPELDRLRPIRLPRDGCVDFFARQKHKACIVVSYYGANIENWKKESERTVKFFTDAGYLRVLLVETYNMSSDVRVIFDTENIQAK